MQVAKKNRGFKLDQHPPTTLKGILVSTTKSGLRVVGGSRHSFLQSVLSTAEAENFEHDPPPTPKH